MNERVMADDQTTSSGPAKGPVLYLNAVHRRYQQGEAELTILRGAELGCWLGQSIALIAPSGAGKSTLLHVAGLLEHPDAGEVFVDGRPTSNLSDAERTQIRRVEMIGLDRVERLGEHEYVAVDGVSMRLLRLDRVLDVSAPGPEAAGGRVHVVGHDWGAIPAWLLAMHHPELVASLTAVSVPHPQAFVTSMVRSTQGLKSLYMLAFQTPFVPEWLARRPGGFLDRQLRAAGMTKDEVARFRDRIVDDGALTTALNWYRALPFGDPRLTRHQVTVPTTMVWSDGDVALGRWGVERTARLVDAPYRFVELTGVSHWIPTQAPEQLAAAILDRVGSA